jgi:hypothetical protein
MTAVERLDPDLTVQGNEIVLQGVTYQVVRRDDVDEKSRRALVNRDPWRWMVALKRPRGQRVYVTFMTEDGRTATDLVAWGTVDGWQ